MNARFLVILDVLINALVVYLSSVAKVDFIQAVVKRSAKQMVLLTIFLSILLLSTWISILGLVFFYLMSIQLSYIQSTLVILGINILGLLVVLISFMCIRNHIESLRRSSSQALLSYLIKSISEALNKHK